MAKARQKTKAKASNSKSKLTEAQIAVHWKEEEYFYPSKKFIAQANLVDLHASAAAVDASQRCEGKGPAHR